MILRLLTCAFLLIAFAGCETPYKKKDDEAKKPMKDQSRDQSFLAFLGRLRIAVNKKDTVMMASLMTPDFGYRWDDGPPGETPFMYWDQHHLWGELSNLLQQQFVPSDMYMVAPPQVVSDANYKGYRLGARTVRGSWRLAYFVPADTTQSQ
jgi:hypothetical protein